MLFVGINQCLTEFSANAVMVVILSLGFVIAAVFFAKMLITKNYGTGIQDYFAQHPETTIAELDNDFAASNHIVGNLWIGDKCTFHVGYLYPYIRENADLVWVYLTRISGKGGGWSINFCDKNQNVTSVTIKSHNKAKEIVEVYQNKFKHIVVGFSEDYEKKYTEDIESFLNIKYNQHL